MSIAATIVSGLLIAIVSGVAGKALADIKVQRLNQELTEIKIILARIETTLIEIPQIKEYTEELFGRVRDVEGKVLVIESNCRRCMSQHEQKREPKI